MYIWLKHKGRFFRFELKCLRVTKSPHSVTAHVPHTKSSKDNSVNPPVSAAGFPLPWKTDFVLNPNASWIHHSKIFNHYFRVRVCQREVHKTVDVDILVLFLIGLLTPLLALTSTPHHNSVLPFLKFSIGVIAPGFHSLPHSTKWCCLPVTLATFLPFFF